jgi:hypothetical protein
MKLSRFGIDGAEHRDWSGSCGIDVGCAGRC